MTWEAYELFKVGEQGMSQPTEGGGIAAENKRFRFGSGPRCLLDLHPHQC